MENISTEQKLELVKQIRSKYNEAQVDMSQREQILYGRSSCKTKEPLGNSNMVDRSWYYDEPNSEETMESFQLGRVRLLIAIILVVGVITLDLNEKSLMGISMDKVFTAISQDYEEEIVAWVGHATAKTSEIDTTISKDADTDVPELAPTKKE